MINRIRAPRPAISLSLSTIPLPSSARFTAWMMTSGRSTEKNEASTRPRGPVFFSGTQAATSGVWTSQPNRDESILSVPPGREVRE